MINSIFCIFLLQNPKHLYRKCKFLKQFRKLGKIRKQIHKQISWLWKVTQKTKTQQEREAFSFCAYPYMLNIKLSWFTEWSLQCNLHKYLQIASDFSNKTFSFLGGHTIFVSNSTFKHCFLRNDTLYFNFY